MAANCLFSSVDLSLKGYITLAFSYFYFVDLENSIFDTNVKAMSKRAAVYVLIVCCFRRVYGLNCFMPV